MNDFKGKLWWNIKETVLTITEMENTKCSSLFLFSTFLRFDLVLFKNRSSNPAVLPRPGHFSRWLARVGGFRCYPRPERPTESARRRNTRRGSVAGCAVACEGVDRRERSVHPHPLHPPPSPASSSSSSPSPLCRCSRTTLAFWERVWTPWC